MKQVKEELLLAMLSAYKGERTIYGALHILQGKKSAQSIQDVHFFSLLPYFHLFPSITREELEQLVTSLQNKRCLVLSEDHRAVLTDIGEERVHLFKEKFAWIQLLDGWKYLKLTEVFWLRLTLTIQTLTQLHIQQKRFIPITNNKEIQKWVKSYLSKNHASPQDDLDFMYNDLKSFLATCADEAATVFVAQLTSPSQVGQTLFQLADTLHLEKDYVYVLHRATLHHLFAALLNGHYPALRPFMGAHAEHRFFTNTAMKTAEFLKQGLTIDEIVKVRRLKKNTIEDHVIELALYDPSFSIRPYISEFQYQQIIQAVHKLNTLKLKQLRDYVGDTYSYFMIRIALTRKDSSYEPE